MKKLQITFELLITCFLLAVLPLEILRAGWPKFVAVIVPAFVVVLLYLERSTWQK